MKRIRFHDLLFQGRSRSDFISTSVRAQAWYSGISIVACTVLLVFTLTNISPAQDGDTSPAQLLEILLSPQTSDEQWHSTSDFFEKRPAEAKIRALFTEVAKGLPEGFTYAAYNCSSPDTDRRVSRWGRYCVAKWLWCEALQCGKPNPQVGKILLELWNTPTSIQGVSVLLAALDYNSWVPEAEESVRSLFKNTDGDPHLRAQAALCLLRHFGSRYHGEVVGFALFSPRDIRDVIFKELVEPPHGRLGIDPVVVRMGFWLLYDEVAKNEEAFAYVGILPSQYGAFLIADRLANYLGVKFTPDYRRPKYQGEQGREALWREATENALAWWPKNKDRFTK